MSYTIDSLDDGHIIVLTMNEDFDLFEDLIRSSLEILPMVEAGPEGIVFISDARKLHFRNLDELNRGTNAARSSENQKLTTHPKIRKTLSITDNKVLQVIGKSLNTASFGYLDFINFETLDAALDYARSLLASSNKVH